MSTVPRAGLERERTGVRSAHVRLAFYQWGFAPKPQTGCVLRRRNLLCDARSAIGAIAENQRSGGAEMTKKSFPLSRVYRLLEPGPVVLLTTAEKGRANVMTMSWHTMMEFEPPLVGCVISDRNHSFGVLKATRECVINIPTVELAAQVVGCGNTSGRKLDKFKALRPHAGGRRAGQGAADRRMLCRSRMQGRRREAGEPNTAFSFSRCCKRGSTPQRKIRGRYIIAAEALSWLPARRSSCLRK